MRYDDMPSRESPRRRWLSNWRCCDAKGGARCAHRKWTKRPVRKPKSSK